jgi:hypothetical protein
MLLNSLHMFIDGVYLVSVLLQLMDFFLEQINVVEAFLLRFQTTMCVFHGLVQGLHPVVRMLQLLLKVLKPCQPFGKLLHALLKMMNLPTEIRGSISMPRLTGPSANFFHRLMNGLNEGGRA